MKILYVSVHSVLEDDEIRMLKALGHDVFPLGVNFGFAAVEPFREPIMFNEREHALLDVFRATGGAYRYSGEPWRDTVLPDEFVAQFDVVIVMHDLSFIQRFWPVLSQRPVIWRTIGQNIEGYEGLAATLMAEGLHVVRYSPVERRAPNYAGETTLIRFAKNPRDYGPWLGHSRHVLTFANAFAQRYPAEAAFYSEIVEGMSPMLGGAGNEALPGCIGLLTPEQQHVHYDACRAYLYCSGSQVPYTLNFMEALMTGMPVVALDLSPRSPYYEVPELLADGAGMVATSKDAARAMIGQLLDDPGFGAEISAKARAKACELFGSDRIAPQWSTLLEDICGN